MKNFFLFFIVLLGAFGLIYTDKINLSNKISLEVLDLFPQNKERELLELYRLIGDSNTILVAQNPNQSPQEFQVFLAQVQTLPNVKEIITHTHLNPVLQNFITQYYFYLGHLKPSNLSSTAIEEKLLNDFSQNALNPIDPLGLIEIPKFQDRLSIQNLPLALIKVKNPDATAIDLLYQQFTSLAQRFNIHHYYSSLFVSVENPQLILKEVNLLTGIACLFFILLYFLILRMPLLTLNSIATILLSNLVAFLALLSFYPKVSIMSLSFGVGISNICIDYMMHHHFLGFYSQKHFRFNTSVFYGFLTTIIGLLVCLFIPFPLLNQLSLYAIINLSVAYVCFAFLYPSIGFSEPKFFSIFHKMHFPFIPVWLFLLLSLGLGGYALLHLDNDLDLSKLDYQNQEFNTQKAFFAPFESQKTFLLEAKNVNALIKQAREISLISPDSVGALGILPTHQEISKREKYFKSLGFNKQKQRLKQALYRLKKHTPELSEILKNAYRSLPTPPRALSIQNLKELQINTLQVNNHLYFQGFIDDLSKINTYRIITQQPQELMQRITSSIFAPMVGILTLAFATIMLLLLILSGKAFLNSSSFVLFPLSCTLFYLSLYASLNIMHLFALLLVVVVSIDYGIYHIKEKDSLGARHAIFFSTLTTLCSFGLFISSQTRALNSFGEVIVVAMISLLCLIFFQKDIGRNETL